MIGRCIGEQFLQTLSFNSCSISPRFPPRKRLLCNTPEVLDLCLCLLRVLTGAMCWPSIVMSPEHRGPGAEMWDESLFTTAHRKLSPVKARAGPGGLSGQISAITDHSNCHSDPRSEESAQCYYECHAISFVVIFERERVSVSQWPSPVRGGGWGWGDHKHQRMPPHKEPQSLEQLSCQVLLAVLYHLTIRHDHDVTQSGQWSMVSGQNHGDEDDNIIGQLDILLISFIYSTYREGLSSIKLEILTF